MILINYGKLKEAEFLIRKAVILNPKDAKAHYNLVIILKDLGKLKEAELSYRKAIKIKPDYAEAQYKTRFSSQIYDLNYDLLVRNPKEEIKSLISWLCWDWSDIYLSPHLNPRSVCTASNIQVRSPINSKSIGGWKNYKEMLKPSIEILLKNERYRNLFL